MEHIGALARWPLPQSVVARIVTPFYDFSPGPTQHVRPASAYRKAIALRRDRCFLNGRINFQYLSQLFFYQGAIIRIIAIRDNPQQTALSPLQPST